MRQAGMADYVWLKWADYRKPHPWEHIDKARKRARCALRAYGREVADKE